MKLLAKISNISLVRIAERIQADEIARKNKQYQPARIAERIQADEIARTNKR
jgi:hypothetical protein